ncbi:hypothetical protein [uncultured Roseobacter sp.]|uniref:hypothetical protein n=1 Tax=uncultured Roseobacter sp. TaxID=114847 RepID=UPI002616E494|nr:hypothetical protein [uncultured Roseobacter sp.]
MSQKKEIMTAAGTLACAVGIGFVMQSGEAAKLRYGPASPPAENLQVRNVPPPDIIEVPGAMVFEAEPVLDINGIVLTSAGVEAPLNAQALNEPVLIYASAASPLYQPVAPESHPKHICPVKLSATTSAAAMVRLSLTAPCMQNERVTVRHEGLEFTETTSAFGGLDMTVPALAEDAAFGITFVNGYTAHAKAKVPSVKLYDRVAVQWEGNNVVQLHVREFGAHYGEDGHVWAGAPRDISSVADGSDGFLTRHGDRAAHNARMTEVYTAPAETAQTEGAIEISIETEVTPANCGREIEATALKLMGGSTLLTGTVSLYVPGCSTVGNFLVLNNPLEDLTVAAN